MSVVNSVKLAVVVSLSLNHQQCNNFHKKQQENAKWTGNIVYVAVHCCVALFGPPLKPCTTPLWGPDGRVHCDADGVWTCSPGPLWKISPYQRHLKKTNCWTRDLRMLVGPVASVTPLTRLQNLRRPQNCCHSGPLLRILLSQTSSDNLLRDRSPAALRTLNHRLLTEERIFSRTY